MTGPLRHYPLDLETLRATSEDAGMKTLFCDQLRRLRNRLDLNQIEVAEILGVSAPRISEWERAARTPKPLTQEAIVARLKARLLRKKAKKKKK